MTALRGLYAITPDHGLAQWPALEARIEDLLAAGGKILQYRNKHPERKLLLDRLPRLRERCEQHGARLIINDDAALARGLSAHGVHIGRDDGGLAQARRALPNGVIGVSCYNRADLALEAVGQGADYIALGSVFASSTKPLAVRAPLTLFTQLKQQITVPLVAIGGINLHNAQQVIAAGADAIAVIDALFGAVDTAQAARQFQALFD